MSNIFLLISASVIFSSGCKTVSDKTTTLPIATQVNKNQTKLEDVKTLTTIVFGSCNRVDEAQPSWSDIAAENPDLWMWLGDSIYGDSEDIEVLRSKYRKQKEIPGYQNILDRMPVIGIWDDHDYGVNNGDETFPIKAASRDAFYDFLDIPMDSPMRNREGAYQSYEFASANKSIKIILLDTRYFKDPIQRKIRKYILDANNDMLGETQWQWLQSEMEGNYDLLIIANGVQVIPEEHPYEKWANYPTSRKRLLEMCFEAEGKVIFLSGDRHFGEISQMTTSNGKILYEVTSSGMTHSYEELNEESNKYRKGSITTQLNYGILQISEECILLQLKGEKGIIRNELSIKI